MQFVKTIIFRARKFGMVVLKKHTRKLKKTALILVRVKPIEISPLSINLNIKCLHVFVIKSTTS